MSDIELYSRSPKKAAFDENRLIRSEYTTTLLNEAVRIGRITEEEALGINAKITNHLAEVVDQYTDGKSSSLPADVTGNLLASLYYNVDAALIASGTPEAALKMVSEKTAAYLYDTGSAALKRVEADCVALLFNVKKNRLIGATEAYNRTIDEDIRAFFKEYNIRFGAHDTPIHPRYRLAVKPGGKGVVRIKRYLTNLLYENAFCANYSSDEVIGVVSYEVMRSKELGREIGNLYVPILLCAVVCQFLMPGFHHVLLSEEDVNEAAAMLDEYTPDELRTVLSAAFKRLPAENMAYHHKVFEDQLPLLIHAIKHGNLKTMIAYMPNVSVRPHKK